MPPVSGVIITHNEAAGIARAIRSLQFADEVVVVDSGSTDSTCDVARDLGARVIVQEWQGFAAQKNFAARQARHDWILSLDADEELNPDALDALRTWKVTEPRAAGYRFARRARYLGRWILHSGWYPDWKIRLYDRTMGKWEGDYIHESVNIPGPVGTMPGEILHYTCDSLEEHRQRIEIYTNLAAREMFDHKERGGLAQGWLLPPWTFLSTYFLRLGVLDGLQGMLIAWMAARYVRRKYAKLRLLQAATAAKP
jgi:glycosyltransferase involved in cell wall biosynthesis